MSLITLADVSPRVCEAEYAVRGPIPALASDIDAEIKQAKAEGKPSKYPFDKLIFCNIGNPQGIGQAPLTFPRQVSSLVTNPDLLKKAAAAGVPKDVIARAEAMIREMGDTGGYSPSEGYAFVRRDIADYITARDSALVQTPADPKAIFLTNGASQGITHVMQLLLGAKTDGIMIPIPAYPLYTANLSLLNGTAVPYFLDESKGWAFSSAELDAAYTKAVAAGIKPKAIIVVNPGNPTGQVLDLDVIRDVVTWAHKRGVLIMADEVYQQNIYAKGKRFFSVRSVALSHPDPKVRREAQVVSFHSTSKGIHGECGRRGGYTEMVNVPSPVMAMMAKLCAIAICPAISGQIMMSLVVKGPQKNGESFERYQEEYNGIAGSLARRATAVPKKLNEVPGITCNAIEGAMYAFPRIRLPAKYIKEAAAKKIPADTMWCRGLVQEEGVVTVPGSGFGQAPGTLHFRTTILPPEDQMDAMAHRIDAYQRRIIKKYGPIDQSKL